MADATPVIPFETRLPCPVCVGVKMDKVALRGRGRVLVLDHCSRCGGVWFEKGEAQRLTQHAPAELWKIVPPRQHILKPPCHECGTPLDRDAAECPVCHKANELHCPLCDIKTSRIEREGLTIDACAKCKGVWFDHTELRQLWSLKLSELARGRSPAREGALGDASDILLASVFWAPDLVLYGGYAVASGVGHAAGAVGQAAASVGGEAGSGLIEMVTNAGESVFEAIVSIISSVFDG